MQSSDDEEIIDSQSVKDYHFVGEGEKPISFSTLPFVWDKPKKANASEVRVFLHGTASSGQRVYKRVTFWKLGIAGQEPTFSVLTGDGKWIVLLKPRKSYEAWIRTIMITAEWLRYLRRSPESSSKCLWDHLSKVFGFDVKPSENDLIAHVSLIRMFAQRDETLAKSQLILMFLEEKIGKGITSDVLKPFTYSNFQITEDKGNSDGYEYENESTLFDSVCAICDNGGEILCCEGRCLRSFHPSRDTGADTACESLGYSKAEVEAIQDFLCRNCQYKKHQCFACGKLGSSDKVAGAEVFHCVSATCGHFYHPTCVAKLLFPNDEAMARTYGQKYASGESFTCPVHRCRRCNGGENKMVKELQFALCRRCPRAYHRKCLPRNICFESSKEDGILQRAWDGLLPNRILMYCLKHEICENLGTPLRNHIIYPEIQIRKLKFVLKKRKISDDLPRDCSSVKPTQIIKKHSGIVKSYSEGKVGRINSEPVRDFIKKLKPSKESPQSEPSNVRLKGVKASAPTVHLTSTGNKFVSSFPVINTEVEKKMIDLMEEVTTSLTLGDIIKKRTMPSTHAYVGKFIDKMIEQGKVEGSVEAIRTALSKLQDGSSIEDAKAVCEPGILYHVSKWRHKLKVYLAPFLLGMRYTSFGRHFTKVDKLKEIVEKLQWYIQNGDTIVDFCCGANDFSTLMKEKLDEVGTECLFRNYDVIKPKNDFNFEKRDWMTVQPEELPPGHQLIMGLNPPFGVKAALANMFIDKALTFMPKLLILIVPEESKRLDKKQPRYDLIWEDCEKLTGKSFYLPGSVDTNDMQMEQWNHKAPPLYLWSRPDWTAKHRVIAAKHGHLMSRACC